MAARGSSSVSACAGAAEPGAPVLRCSAAARGGAVRAAAAAAAVPAALPPPHGPLCGQRRHVSAPLLRDEEVRNRQSRQGDGSAAERRRYARLFRRRPAAPRASRRGVALPPGVAARATPAMRHLLEETLLFSHIYQFSSFVLVVHSGGFINLGDTDVNTWSDANRRLMLPCM